MWCCVLVCIVASCRGSSLHGSDYSTNSSSGRTACQSDGWSNDWADGRTLPQFEASRARERMKRLRTNARKVERARAMKSMNLGETEQRLAHIKAADRPIVREFLHTKTLHHQLCSIDSALVHAPPYVHNCRACEGRTRNSQRSKCNRDGVAGSHGILTVRAKSPKCGCRFLDIEPRADG